MLRLAPANPLPAVLGAAVVVCVELTACVSYHPEPLATQPVMPARIEAGTAEIPSVSGPPRRAVKIDPADGLDVTEVAALAVLRSPDLKVARAMSKVARAQAFSAGLLPEPQFSLTRDFTLASTPDVTSAFAVGIAQDISSLVQAPARRRERTALEKQADLDLLWQELQTVARARQLFNQYFASQDAVALLQQQREAAAVRAAALGTALDRRWVTAASAGAGFAALASIDTLLADSQKQATATRLDLHALIGLAPDAPLQLNAAASWAPFDRAAIEAAKREVVRRRPDLVALQAGYAAQEERVRIAVLSQFPPLTVSFAQARDTAGIKTRGFGVSLGLPIFGSGRAAVAIERADRERLRTEFDVRLLSTWNDIDVAAESLRLLEQRTPGLEKAVAQLKSVASDAALAASSRDIDQLTYADLVEAYVSKQVELLVARQSRVDLQTTLAALLAVDPEQLSSGETE